MFAAQVDISQTPTFMDLERLQGLCQSAEILQQMVGESSGSNWVRMQFTCCMSAGLPIALVPVGFNFSGGGFEAYEGTYCPRYRDVSGRFAMVRKRVFEARDDPNPGKP